MRKTLAVFLCLAFAVPQAFAFMLIPKAGADISGTINYEKDPDREAKRGFSVGADTRGQISGYFSCGAGFEYLLPRGFAGFPENDDFSFLPVYFSVLFYPLGAWDKARPYIKAGAGYSVLAMTNSDADMSGGVYWAAGAGAEYKNFVGEVTASNYGAEYDGQKFSYRKIGLSIGYKFDINFFEFKEEGGDF